MRMTLKEMRDELSSWVPGFTPGGYIAAINRAYDELAHLYPWTKLDTEFKIITKPFVAVGGAMWGSGLTTITAATNVSAAWGTSAGGTNLNFAGMFIKKDDEAAYYTITSNTSIQVTITESYPGKTTTAEASSGESYIIFKHIYAIPSAVETVVHLMHDSYLEEMDTSMFEDIDPDFDEEGEPSKWRNAGVDSNGQTLVQIFPPRIDDVYEIRGRGRLRASRMTADADIPYLEPVLIMAFAEVELMKRKRMTNPDTISDDMLNNATNNAQRQLEQSLKGDWKLRTQSRYVHDNFFRSYHRGQKWLVAHDPWDS
jgi:hypothetical protein